MALHDSVANYATSLET